MPDRLAHLTKEAWRAFVLEWVRGGCEVPKAELLRLLTAALPALLSGSP